MLIHCNHSFSLPLFQQSFALSAKILLQSSKAVVKVRKASRMARGVVAGGTGGPCPSNFFEIVGFSEI